MTSEISIFDPEMPKLEVPKVEVPKVEVPKVEVPKVEVPNASVLSEDSDSSIFDSIEDFFENLSFEEHPEYLLIGILILCIIAYFGYEMYKKKEGLINNIEKVNIDFNEIDMYYINIPNNTKRGVDFEKSCKENELSVNRYEGIDSKDITNEMVEQILSSENSGDFKKSVLENNRENIEFLGSFLSHIGVYQEFMESNKPYCIICEDTVTFNTPSFKNSLNKYMEHMPRDWDIILLGNKGSGENLTSKHNIIYNIEELDNNNCYMINKSSCKKLLENLMDPRWYLDWSISELAKNGFIKIYGLTEPLVI